MRQIIEMMDNFMQLFVCVGVSGMGRGAGDLKRLYEQAASALAYRFPDGTGKLNFYREGTEPEEIRLPGEEKWLEDICGAVEKGDAEKPFLCFTGCSGDRRNTAVPLPPSGIPGCPFRNGAGSC